MPLQIVRASKKDARARLALLGPTGSGKTYTALEIALGMARLEEIGVIDTEHKSSEKYVPIFGEFDVIHLDNYDPRLYVEAIQMLAQAGYKLIVVDSLSHAWAGKGGALELKDRATQRNGGNSYTAWGQVTPLQNQLIETIIGCPAHVIATMRSKMDHIQEVNERGKTVIKKVGMAPVQRDGVEYEFDVIGELDIDNVMTITKTRNPAFKDLQLVKPTRRFGADLKAWLEVPGAAPAHDPMPEVTNVLPMVPRAAQGQPEAGPPPRDDDHAFAEGIATQAPPAHEPPPEGLPDPGGRYVWWPDPNANTFKCQAHACEVTYSTWDEIGFGGRRFRGRTLQERCFAEEGPKKPLCAPHLKRWTDGDDVFTEEASA